MSQTTQSVRIPEQRTVSSPGRWDQDRPTEDPNRRNEVTTTVPEVAASRGIRVLLTRFAHPRPTSEELELATRRAATARAVRLASESDLMLARTRFLRGLH